MNNYLTELEQMEGLTVESVNSIRITNAASYGLLIKFTNKSNALISVDDSYVDGIFCMELIQPDDASDDLRSLINE